MQLRQYTGKADKKAKVNARRKKKRVRENEKTVHWYSLHNLKCTIYKKNGIQNGVISNLARLSPIFQILLYLPGLSYCFLLFSFNTQLPLK